MPRVCRRTTGCRDRSAGGRERTVETWGRRHETGVSRGVTERSGNEVNGPVESRPKSLWKRMEVPSEGTDRRKRSQLPGRGLWVCESVGGGKRDHWTSRRPKGWSRNPVYLEGRWRYKHRGPNQGHCFVYESITTDLLRSHFLTITRREQGSQDTGTPHKETSGEGVDRSSLLVSNGLSPCRLREGVPCHTRRKGHVRQESACPWPGVLSRRSHPGVRGWVRHYVLPHTARPEVARVDVV